VLTGGKLVVTWGEAFSAAAKGVAYGVLWYILGALIAGAGYALLNGLVEVPLDAFTLTVVSAILMAVGIILIMLGVLAAAIKILSESVAQEVVERLRGDTEQG